ncbi:hypothetical protein [Rhizobium leguminosarum]|uniref:hypothetical protein n=1 Tax=Rhizobium leguminosarum TaxID=384 RepID=UPI0035149474
MAVYEPSSSTNTAFVPPIMLPSHFELNSDLSSSVRRSEKLVRLSNEIILEKFNAKLQAPAIVTANDNRPMIDRAAPVMISAAIIAGLLMIVGALLSALGATGASLMLFPFGATVLFFVSLLASKHRSSMLSRGRDTN